MPIITPSGDSGGIASGTGFPSSPADGTLFFRTDTRIIYEYALSVTKWLSVDRKYAQLSPGDLTDDAGLTKSSAVGVVGWFSLFEDMYVESWVTTSRVAGTNDGSNFYTYTLIKETVAEGQTTVATFNTSADTAANNTVHTVSVGSLFAAATNPMLVMTSAKTGVPTGYRCPSLLVVRSVG